MKFYRSTAVMAATLIARIEDTRVGDTPITLGHSEEEGQEPLRLTAHLAATYKPDICNLLVTYENGAQEFLSPAVADVWEEVEEPEPSEDGNAETTETTEA